MPLIRRRAGLNAYEARWQFFKEDQDVAPLQLPTNGHPAIGINAMHLQNRLRNIQTDLS